MRRTILRRMAGSLGSDLPLAAVPRPAGSNVALRSDWDSAASVADPPIWLKPSSSPYRRPSILFSRNQGDVSSMPAGAFAVSAADLGRSVPLFKVTSQSCEYFALRLPLLKAGFKRIADAESPLDANVMWGKSWPTSTGSRASVDNVMRSMPSTIDQPTSSDKAPEQSPAPTLPPLTSEYRKPVHCFQKVNHFSGSHRNLGCKSGMARNLERLAAAHPGQDTDFAPQTWRVPEDIEALEDVLHEAREDELFIMKPSRGSCGRGVRVVRPNDLALTRLLQQATERIPGARSPLYVVQRYLHDPLLVANRKFDFRLYVCVTSYDPLVVYVHDHGLVRFAAKAYDSTTSDITDNYSHLTNFSIGRKYQMEHPEDVATARIDGSSGSEDSKAFALKWSIAQLTKHLVERYGGHAVALQVWSAIEDVIVKMLIAAQMPIYRCAVATEGNHDASIELYGFDIMLDAQLRPWLIEVNTLPSLESSSAFDYNVKTTVVTDLLNLAQLQLFDRNPRAFESLGIVDDAFGPNAACHAASHDVGTVWREQTPADPNEPCHPAQSLCGRRLSPQEDQADTVARIRDELTLRGGFHLAFPTADRLRRLSHLCNPSMARTSRTTALWADVNRCPELYAVHAMPVTAARPQPPSTS